MHRLAPRRTAAACLVLAFGLAGCGWDRHSDDQRGQLTPPAALCAVVDGPTEDLNVRGVMEEHRFTFSSLVDEERWSDAYEEVWAVLGLSRQPIFLSAPIELGPYEPAILYILERGFAWDPEAKGEHAMPTRTEAVVESAERADRDLAHGLCPLRGSRRDGG